MKKCILHIGMHKTGSSSIQAYLAKHRKNLGKGMKYANLGSPNHSGAFIYMFCKRLEDFPHFANRGLSVEEVQFKIERFRANFIRELESDFDTLIFSGEEIVNLNESELNTLKKQLAQFVDEVEIVAYVRPPVSFMSSAFQQRLNESPRVHRRPVCLSQATLPDSFKLS